jgi:hypothetical protein
MGLSPRSGLSRKSAATETSAVPAAFDMGTYVKRGSVRPGHGIEFILPARRFAPDRCGLALDVAGPAFRAAGSMLAWNVRLAMAEFAQWLAQALLPSLWRTGSSHLK